MKGDFTRDTFRPFKNYSRVLMQQGSLQLDADWNEQISILLNQLRSMARDLIGPYGGPADIVDGGGTVIERNLGFEITAATNASNELTDLKVGPGRYYVDGILCEVPAEDEHGTAVALTYYTQPSYPLDSDHDKFPDLPFLVYLEVFERFITGAQDGHILDPALGGVATAGRGQIVQQVRAITAKAAAAADLTCANVELKWKDWITAISPGPRGLLKAQARKPQNVGSPCTIPFEARFRGYENQLYRVEIHDPGPVNTATFKWSRDNGSVAYAVRTIQGTAITLEELPRDERLALKAGDWVAIEDDETAGKDLPDPLVQVGSVSAPDGQVFLKEASALAKADRKLHTLLRRWDQRESAAPEGALKLTNGVAKITEGSGDSGWLNLEDGVQIQFQKPGGTTPNEYRSGDYWLIPARTATASVEWPHTRGTNNQKLPAAVPPHGIERHYAPLAIVTQAGAAFTITDLRPVFKPGAGCK